MKTWFVLFLIMLAYSSPSLAQYYYGGVFYDRENTRAPKKWTLQDWRRNRSSDMWFSSKGPSSTETMWGASYKSDQVYSSTSAFGYFTLHVPILGFSFEYDNNVQESYTDLTGMLNVRVFGNALQNTHLTLSIGQRTRSYSTTTPESVYKNQFGQASLQLYITRYFGIEGSHRTYVRNVETALSQETSGTFSEAGIFVDLKTTRIFGSWYTDTEVRQSTLSPFTITTTSRIGTKAGIKFYF